VASVGEHLRELRQRRGLSLEELSRTTRVPPRYLEALESDNFSALPAPVFVRGFIRAYCQAVGAPADEALARYDHQGGVAPVAPPVRVAIPADPRPSAVVETEARSRSAVLVSFVLLVVLGMALFAVAFVTQPQLEERVDRRAPGEASVSAVTPVPSSSEPSAAMRPPTPTAPTTSSPTASAPGTSPARPATSQAPPATNPPAPTVSPPSPPRPTSPPEPAVRATPPTPPGVPATRAPPVGTSMPAPTAGPATAEPARSTPREPWFPDVQAATGGVASPYRLVARASEATWIRVRTEDGRLTEETVPAGQTREWVSNRPFVLTVGNAGGVTLELNGRTLPPLGPSGAVISRIVLPPQ
jgi:cytoskeleton protein RodZ